MVKNEVAENVLATVGTICWCIQLIPQIIRNFKVKECTGVPPLMMFLWAASGVPFAIYFFGIDGSIPLRVQPQLFTFFALVTWLQTLYYPPVKLARRKVALIAGSFIALSIGLEVGFILWLRPLYRRGIEYPMLIIGIVASVLLALGLLPPYYELYKRRGRVVGINFIFLGLDSTGALLSMISIFVGLMDVLSIVLYAIVLGLEIGIFSSQIIWYIFGGRKVIAEEKRLKKETKEKNEDEENIENIEGVDGDRESENTRTHSSIDQTSPAGRVSMDKPYQE